MLWYNEVSYVFFLFIGLNLSLGWKQEDACEFQDGVETVDTAGVLILSTMLPKPNTFATLPSMVHAETLSDTVRLYTHAHPQFTKVQFVFLPYSSKLLLLIRKIHFFLIRIY